MKEASGEANLTVITIILIAVVVAVATPLVSNLMQTSSDRACCTDAGGIWDGSSCAAAKGATGAINQANVTKSYNACTANLNNS